MKNTEILGADKLQAPFLLRCGALIIDYILIVLLPAIGLIIARFYGYDGAKLLNSSIYDVSLFVASLIAIANLLILPVISGQSVGKMLTGLRIVTKKGKKATFKRILVRNFLGYLVTFLTLGLGFLLCAFNSQGRALHDFLAGTTVIKTTKNEYA